MIEEHHLQFDARRDEKYLYIRCQQHPEIVFMIDAIEERLIGLVNCNTWIPILHSEALP